MATNEVGIDQELFRCSICLDLLKLPVTIPCGHSYCMSCIKTHWDEEVGKQSYSCPQCRQNFTQRPVLVKNTMLALLMEGFKKSGPPAAPVPPCSAAHGHVSCDLCSGRKVKAVKSCLQCLVSYCEEHLQPHYDVAALKKHKLVEPTENLQDNICSQHDEVMKMFCRTDQQCICYLCSVDQHKGHDTVTAAAERTEKQRQLENFRKKILQRIVNKEKNVACLQHEEKNILHSAYTAVDYTHQGLSELIELLEKRLDEVKKQIRAQQEAEEHRVKELQDKLQQEITELKRTHSELDSLSQTDHLQLEFTSLSTGSVKPDCSQNDNIEQTFFNMVSAVVKELHYKLQVNEPPDGPRTAPATPEPVPRDKLLQYACDVTLDINTAHDCIYLFSQNRRARFEHRSQGYGKRPSRFTQRCQVLSKEALTGRCYIEMNLNYFYQITVGVSYKTIDRKCIHKSGIGNFEDSWGLECVKSGENNPQMPDRIYWEKVKTKGRVERLGLFLDHDAGVLTFYKLNEPQSLIHEVHTTFTQPLFLGIEFRQQLDNVEICTPV